MKSYRFSLLLSLFLLFSLIGQVNACDTTAFNSCRDFYTKNIKKQKLKRLTRKLKKNKQLVNKLTIMFKKFDRKIDEAVLFGSLLSIPSISEKLLNCKHFQNEIEQGSACRSLILTDLIYNAYSLKLIDASATQILLNKFKSKKKSMYVGSIKSYSSKIYLLKKSFLKNRTIEELNVSSPLAQKKYLQKLGPIKRLTPRQKLLMKYNYAQIKYMGKVLIQFNKRVQAREAGLFYDYDGDGEYDEIISLDSAEQYKMTVKLLNLELEKLSQSGEIFNKNKPTYMDLLAAAGELGLFANQTLTQMVELPYLYQKKKPAWKVALNIAWTVGKGVINTIPGASLYAILPIILVESYVESKKLSNKPSSLHLFSF